VKSSAAFGRQPRGRLLVLVVVFVIVLFWLKQYPKRDHDKD